jgi:hypothetical protein
MSDETPVIPIRDNLESPVSSSRNDKETFIQATLAAIGCVSWIGVFAALIGLFALVRAVFF